MSTPQQARGAADRVNRVHRQARWSLGLGVVFLFAALVAAGLPHSTGPWLPLHLFLVGGVLTIISGATQMLAVTWSSSPAPADTAATGQRILIAGGALAVAAGREGGWSPLLAGGGLAVAAGLVLLAVLLVQIRMSAVTDRFKPAIDAYLIAIGFGLVGVALGTELGTRSTVSEGLRAAHLTVNVLGLVGLVILGTLPFFTATQARMKMSPRAHPRRIRAVVTGAALSVALAAGGHATGHPVGATVGLGIYALAILSTVGLLPAIGRRQLDWAGARLVQLLVGIAWWAAMVVLLAVHAANGHSDGPVLRALAIGGIGQIVMASLAYFGPVLRGGGHVRLSEGFALTRSWLALLGANLAALGAVLDWPLALGGGLAVWALDGAARLVVFIRRTFSSVEAVAKP